MEATGPYWQAFAEFLHPAGGVVSVLNPAQVAHVARARLQRAKTDGSDAHLRWEYGRVLSPSAWTPPPLICQRLGLRDERVQTRRAERNRRHARKRHPHADQPVVQRLQGHSAYLTRPIQALAPEIRALLLSHHPWAAQVRRLLTVKGLGLLTIGWLLVATHAFARWVSPQAAVAFAGLAPHARVSGQGRGKRSVGNGGHAARRKALYRAACSAARFNPRLQVVYPRLIARGKHPKLAFCALTRKRLHLAWAWLVNQPDFDPAGGLSA